MMQQILLGYGGSSSGGQIDTSAAHFYDFSTSYDDQVEVLILIPILVKWH